MKKLTDYQIKSLPVTDKVKKIFDGYGLYLELRPPNSKTFRVAYNWENKRKIITIGQYPSISLSQARKRALEIKELLDEGIDPNPKRKTIIKKTHTFEELAKEYLEILSPNVNPRRIIKLTGLLNNYVLPTLGNRNVQSIERADVLDLVLDLNKNAPKSVPDDVLGLIKAVLDFAVDKGIIQFSCYSPSIKKYLTKYIQKPHPHVDESELPKLLKDLENSNSNQYILIALKLIILLFPRASELRYAKWIDLDIDNGILNIPSHRMKGLKHHKEAGMLERQIMLSNQAITLLGKLKKLTGYSEYLFPNFTNKGVISDGTMNKILNSLGYKKRQDIHGFRGLASTILNNTYPEKRYVIELCLAHRVGSQVERAYNHSKQLEHQKEVWQIWADFLETKGLKI